MAFTNQDVMNLRAQTGAGMMDCKKALTETDGNMEKAAEYLREKGIAKAAKKASRIAAEGAVVSYCDEKTKVAVVAEINCETDFVARGEAFMKLCDEVVRQIAAKPVASVEELLAEASLFEKGKTVQDVVTEAVAKIGENISVRRFSRYEKGIFETYIHMGGRIGVLLEATCDAAAAGKPELKALIHDVALQIAAMNPEFISSAEIDASRISKEREILFVQAKTENSSKPDAVIEKMVDGRMRKYFEEVCLNDQKFFKDPAKSIAQLLKEFGANVAIKRFTRYEKGEGIEKRQDDLAAEVNEQLAKMKK